MQLGLRQRLESCRSLPSLPGVAVHVLRLCQKENFDIGDVARAIGTDAALSTKIVALVNCPLFSLRQEVRTVSQALVLLGVNAVRTIALSFAVASELRGLERAGFDRRPFWRRAVFAAAVAQDLARGEAVKNPTEAFLGALLQDVGELALQQAAPDTYGPMTLEAGADHAKLVALEQAAYGCDHAEVGRWLLTQWRLPEVVRVAVGSSHDPTRWQRGIDPATETTVKVVALSGAIADVWVLPHVEVASRHACQRAREILGLDDTRFLALLRRVNGIAHELAPLFELNLGDDEALASIVERATYAIEHPGAPTEETVPISIGDVVAEESPPVDALTGLASRSRFEAYVAAQFELAKRDGKPLSVIVCGPDHFDLINQTFGREAGDRALRAVGLLVGQRLRHRDLTDTHAAGAATVAERLRKQIEDALHNIGIGDPVRMTMSLGCATLDEALGFSTPAELVAAAESTLAQAKASGGNRVMSHVDLTNAA